MPERRKYRPREMKLVNDWLAKFHPTALQWKRVRLGPLPGTPPSKLYTSLRRWADIVFFENDTVHIVEAKMRPDPGGIAQLELYQRLFPETPEFSAFKDKPIKLIYLTTVKDDFIKKLCEEKGFEFVVFRPPWVEEYWKSVIE